MRQTGALGACFGLALVLAGCSGGGEAGGASWTACKNAVKAELKNPATAEFELMRTTIKETVIDGKLTAQDISGIAQELKFHCKMSGESVTSAQVVPIS